MFEFIGKVTVCLVAIVTPMILFGAICALLGALL